MEQFAHAICAKSEAIHFLRLFCHSKLILRVWLLNNVGHILPLSFIPSVFVVLMWKQVSL